MATVIFFFFFSRFHYLIENYCFDVTILSQKEFLLKLGIMENENKPMNIHKFDDKNFIKDG